MLCWYCETCRLCFGYQSEISTLAFWLCNLSFYIILFSDKIRPYHNIQSTKNELFCLIAQTDYCVTLCEHYDSTKRTLTLLRAGKCLTSSFEQKILDHLTLRNWPKQNELNCSSCPYFCAEHSGFGEIPSIFLFFSRKRLILFSHLTSISVGSRLTLAKLLA